MRGTPMSLNGAAWVPQGSNGRVGGQHKARQTGSSFWWWQQGCTCVEIHSKWCGGVVGLLSQSFTLTKSTPTMSRQSHLSSEAMCMIGATFFQTPRMTVKAPVWTASKIIHFKITVTQDPNVLCLIIHLILCQKRCACMQNHSFQ